MNRNDALNIGVRFVPSLLPLQQWAINTIVENVGGYRDLITKKIAPPLRKIVFDQAMERKKEIGEDQVWAALPYLDQHKTTENFSTKEFATIFRLKRKTGGFSEACVSMEEFLQYLVDFVPNLKKLEIKDPRAAYSCSEGKMFKKIRLQPAATDLLLNMENLTEVGIHDVSIKFTEFVRVCRESHNLQSIQANNILVDMEPTNSMKNILETVGSKFDFQEYEELKFPRKIEITLMKTRNVQPYRRAKGRLSNDFLDLIPSALTNIEIFDCIMADIQSGRSCILRNLPRIGGTLKTLRFDSLRPEFNITFKHIFDHCHVLETLALCDSCVTHEDPIASFGQLKKFFWTHLLLVNWNGTLALDKLFSAPLLENIYIRTSVPIDLGDIGSLLNQIRNRQILTKLTKLHIWYSVPRDYPRSKEEEFHEFARELRSLGCDANVLIETLSPVRPNP